MCGLLGHFTRTEEKSDFLESGIKKLQHRGPDSFDKHVSENGRLGFGHTRLAIQDLTSLGSQPMWTDDRKFCIVFNGEIYNFRELRQELKQKGYRFRTGTDTEVILNGFVEQREEFFTRLNGMFAIVIWDATNKKLYFARDPFGIKPLYYYKEGDSIFFASEQRVLNPLSSEVDPISVGLFLLLGSIPEPRALYKKVFSFPPGSHATFTPDRGLEIQKFFQKEFLPPLKIDYQEAVRETRRLFTNSIERHMISDAPLGAFLSGGVDSSAIVAAAAGRHHQLKTISVSFDDPRYSENQFQKMISEKYQTDHFEYKVGFETFREHFSNFLTSIDSPMIDGFNTYLASFAAAKQGLKCILAGQGADELFYGYNNLVQSLKRRYQLIPECALAYRSHQSLKSQGKLNSLSFRTFSKAYPFMHTTPGKFIFSPANVARSLEVNEEELFHHLLTDFALQPEWNFTTRVNSLEFDFYLTNQLLKKDDNASMSFSIETRIPFLDLELAQFVLRIPPAMKFAPKYNKALFVDAVQDLLPEEIYRRRKKGFSAPFKDWFKSSRTDYPTHIQKHCQNEDFSWRKVSALLALDQFGVIIDDI